MNVNYKERLIRSIEGILADIDIESKGDHAIVPNNLAAEMASAAEIVYDTNTNTQKFLHSEGYLKEEGK